MIITYSRDDDFTIVRVFSDALYHIIGEYRYSQYWRVCVWGFFHDFVFLVLKVYMLVLNIGNL